MSSPPLKPRLAFDRPLSRRRFLSLTSVTLGALALPGRTFALRGVTAPSNRITLGFIGVGGHGHGYNLKSFLEQDDAQVVAVCDAFASRTRRARDTVDARYGAKGCREYADFRALLAAPDIDAVVISTPDHWHVPMSMLALAAGKDVMCEKPTLTIAEGRALVERVKERNAVFQVGLEDRSMIKYHMLASWVRNGAIGQLQRIHVGLPPGTVFPLEDAAPVPPDLDYNLWTGPAPFSPYSPHRTGPQQWRNNRDYAGGKFADWGAHLVDTAQVANFAENTSPVEVSGEGDVPPNAMTTMPVNYRVRYRYANGVELNVTSGPTMIRCEGSEGWISNHDWAGRFEASDPSLLLKKYPAEISKLWPLPRSEHRNFLDCIRSRQPTTYTAEAGHRLSTTLHLGNIAMQLGRTLRWDPTTETFPGDAAANALRSREPRKWD